jgi:NDP-sugar pyrophosphorylase family protein
VIKSSTHLPIATALVLAAGKSTRIQAVARHRPKPLIEVGGQTVLERNLRQLARAGVRDAWINLHYEADQIRDAVGDGRAYGLNVRYSWEPHLLGTAGAVKKLEAELGRDSFLVAYGDNLVALDHAAMAAQHRRSGTIATIAVFDRDAIPNTGLAGGRVCVDAEGYVTDFQEGGGTSPYVNAGVYVLEPDIMRAIPADAVADFGRDVFPALLRDGHRLGAYFVDGYCLGIDTPEGLARAIALLDELELRQPTPTP